MQNIEPTPTSRWRAFWQAPFTKGVPMSENSGGSEVRIRNGKISASDVDLAALLKAIYHASTVFTLGFLLLTGRSSVQISPETLAQLAANPAVKAAVQQLLAPPDTAEPDDPAPPPKAKAKNTKRTPPPKPKPKGPGASLREGELITTRDRQPPIIGSNQIPLPPMRMPR